MEKVNKHFGGLESLARSIAVPRDSKPHRMPTFPALERTATLSFTDTSTFSLTGNTTGAAIVIREPGYPLWMAQPMAAHSQYGVVSSGTFTVPAVFTQSILCADVEYMFGNSFITFPTVTYDGNDYLLLGGNVDNTQLRLAVEMEVAAGSSISSMYMEYEYITEVGTKINSQTITVAPAAGGGAIGQSFALPSAAFAVRILEVVFTAGAAGVSYTAASVGITTTAAGVARPLIPPLLSASYNRILPFVVPPELTSVSTPWQNTRATAVAALFSNVTSVMNKEGTVSAARVGVRNFPIWDAMQWNNFGAVHPKDRYFGALENGLYTFTLPDALTEVYQDVADNPTVTTVASRAKFEFNSFAYANCILFRDIDATNGSTLAITLDRHIEFRTTSRLFPTDFSKLTLEVYHASQMALVQMGVFTENPIHLATIANMAAQAARAVWPIVRPYATQAVAAVGKKALNWAGGKIGGTMQQKQMVQVKPKAQKKVPKKKPPASRRK